MNHEQASKLIADLDRIAGAAHWVSPTLLDELPVKHVRVIQDANMSFVRAVEEMRADIKVMEAQWEAAQGAKVAQSDMARQGQVDPNDPNAPADQRTATSSSRAVNDKESQRKGFGESKSADAGASDATKK